MTTNDRKKQMRIVAEMLLVHLPDQLGDQSLACDLLTVTSLAIRAAAADAEKSAAAWDKRAYHVRADELRREWEQRTSKGPALPEPPNALAHDALPAQPNTPDDAAPDRPVIDVTSAPIPTFESSSSPNENHEV